MDLEEHPVLANLLVKVGVVNQKSASQTHTPAEHNAPLKFDRELTDFENRIDKVLSQQQSNFEGRVFLVGLSKVREKLGSRWRQVESKVHATVNAIIKSHSAPGDIHVRYDELAYLLVFASLGETEAKLKSAAISEEILGQLFGRESISELMDVKIVSNNSSNGKIQFENLPSTHELLGNAALDLNNLNSKHKNPELPVAGGFNSQIPMDLKEVEFVFRPLLAVRNKIISTFLCVPIRATKGQYDSNYDILQNSSDRQQILDLDLLTLEDTAKEFGDLVKKGGRSLVGIPVHFETLAQKGDRTKYINRCA